MTLHDSGDDACCLAIRCILFARTMGYPACYTDHSLFGFADAASIHINKMLTFTLADIDHAICVSNTCREVRAVEPPGCRAPPGSGSG